MNDLKYIAFDKLFQDFQFRVKSGYSKEDARADSISEFSIKNQIPEKHTWLPQQLLAYFGSNWFAVKNASENTHLFNGEQTILANAKDDYNRGIAFFCTYSRGHFFKSTIKELRQYSSPIGPMVPIILASFKRCQNIQYQQWDRDNLGIIVDDSLQEAMLSTKVEISKEALLDIRFRALTDMSGARAGIMNSPATCTKTNRMGESALKDLPKLAKYWAIQTWCAHPTNRNVLGIYDQDDWDATPENLIEDDLVSSTSTKSTLSRLKSRNTDLW